MASRVDDDDRRLGLRRLSDQRPPDYRRPDSALDRLRHLYEISQRLADFKSIEETLPSVLAAVRKVLPLQRAILVLETGSATPLRTTTTWTFHGATEEAVKSAEAHADAAFTYLLGLEP